ncbi:hypothetical protein V5799_020073 [Amblyomma americanum]|uniref:Uncharacterized protein n=1 Tax=Amblyomma americanum TaxID=6943 RepID=A0AAQ4EVH2_AMBAM
MEPVEQDWRKYYDACYDRPGGPPAGDVTSPTTHVTNLAGNPAAEPVGSMPRILDEFASKTAACKRAVNDSGAGTMLVRTLVFLFVVCLCVIFLSLVVTGSTWSSTSGGASKEKQSRVTESSIHVDAPRQPAQPVVQPGRKRAAARDRASPTGVQLAHNKEAKAAPPVEANLWNADKDDGEDEKESRARICPRNDVKSSYWYREGKACVEWKYPDGYCATKHRGVARSLRECRDSCMGPGTHEGSCTLPAEYTCPVDELRFPYFAHALPNGTVECLVADAEKLRPHKCMTGENKHATQDICREACARNKGPASTNLTPSPSEL